MTKNMLHSVMSVYFVDDKSGHMAGSPEIVLHWASVGLKEVEP